MNQTRREFTRLVLLAPLTAALATWRCSDSVAPAAPTPSSPTILPASGQVKQTTSLADVLRSRGYSVQTEAYKLGTRLVVNGTVNWNFYANEQLMDIGPTPLQPNDDFAQAKITANSTWRIQRLG